ncbi:MAG: hypothetical protein LBD06_02640 [Candidatus Accumulibacter sp.]|nr:hypothetical protein [Accumulibacter sp.]
MRRQKTDEFAALRAGEDERPNARFSVLALTLRAGSQPVFCFLSSELY